MVNVINIFFLSIATIVFVAALTANELDQNSNPDFREPPEAESRFGFLDTVTNLFIKMWEGVTLIFSVVTFNVPGAPWYARVIVGTLISTPIIWGIVLLIRGTGE